MHIEVIGPTSAGKTSFIKRILLENRTGDCELVTSYDFVLRLLYAGWIKQHAVRMALLNTAAFLASLLTWKKHGAFYTFALGVIQRLPADVPITEKIKLSRLVFRNVGIYAIVQRFRTGRQVVIADEGTLHLAHSLFVHASIAPDLDLLERFTRLVPYPDAIVYMREATPVLIARTSARGHKRVAGGSLALVEAFIQHAQIVFEALASHPIIASRLLTVNNSARLDTNGQQPAEPALRAAKTIVETGLAPIEVGMLP